MRSSGCRRPSSKTCLKASNCYSFDILVIVVTKTNIKSLYTVYTLFNIARALVSFIGPIYLYRLGFSLQALILFMICTALCKVGSLPLVFKTIARYGARPCMFVG